MRRDDLYPCGYDRGRAPIGMPKPQPRTPDPCEYRLIARLCRITFAVAFILAMGLIAAWKAGLLNGRG